jgi:magnesium-protoporphyrin O-methyltransferase
MQTQSDTTIAHDVRQTYVTRRTELETYFDRTAVEAWKRLTSDAPVGRIRATVRAGRDTMRAQLLDWLPQDLRGARLLDAGCGTGALAIEAARRGADVVAVDVSGNLVRIAQERAPSDFGHGRITWGVGDMLDPAFGEFDHVVAMDSLIHYGAEDLVDALSGLAARTRNSVIATFAPRNPALTVMHAVGKFFPRGNRAPAIVPITPDDIAARLVARFEERADLESWLMIRTQRIASGFYTSQAMELRPS